MRFTVSPFICRLKEYIFLPAAWLSTHPSDPHGLCYLEAELHLFTMNTKKNNTEKQSIYRNTVRTAGTKGQRVTLSDGYERNRETLGHKVPYVLK